MYLVKSPLLLKWFYSALTWNKSRSQKIIYLTFDDGPIPNVTEFVLNTLKSFKIKATFFCIGDNILKHPTLFERIKDEGHSIGNHTFNHLNGWKTDDKTYVQNFLKCQELTQTNLFRPPFGRIKKSQVRSLQSEVRSFQSAVCSLESEVRSLESDLLPKIDSGLKTTDSRLKIIMWDVLSGDFDLKLTPEKCYQNIIKHTENGSIIVFHDSLKAYDRLKYALPKAIEHLINEGYQFSKL